MGSQGMEECRKDPDHRALSVGTSCACTHVGTAFLGSSQELLPRVWNLGEGE
jgi:hypothetical protein